MFAIDSATFGTSAAQNMTHKYDLKQRKGALHCVRSWAAKGYQPIYLSGRQVASGHQSLLHVWWSGVFRQLSSPVGIGLCVQGLRATSPATSLAARQLPLAYVVVSCRGGGDGSLLQ